MNYPRYVTFENGDSEIFQTAADLKSDPRRDLVISSIEYKYDNFLDYLKTMREYQSEAIDAICGAEIGQIILPCGTGKTRIQIATHLKHMRSVSTPSIYLVTADTIALCSDLLKAFLDILVGASIKFDILCLNSSDDEISNYTHPFKGKLSEATCNFVSTTTETDILRSVERAKRNNRHLLIISTYHSVNRLKCLDDKSVSISTYDEAHTIVQDQFYDNCASVRNKICRNYFFTATPRDKNFEDGMADETFFGPVIYSKSPREMIELGEIIRPTIHTISCSEEDSSSDNMAITTIINSCRKHEQIMCSEMDHRKTIAPKILYAASGSDDIKTIYQSPEFRKFCIDEGWNVFVFMSADSGTYSQNFKETTRHQCLQNLKKLKDSDKAILLHIQILTCGIDLPTLTGIILGRDMRTTTLIQTIGRGVRLHSKDREKLYSKELLVSDLDKYIKPTTYIMIPTNFKDTVKESGYMKSLIRTVYTNYGITRENIIQTDEYSTKKPVELPSLIEQESSSSQKDYELVHVLESIVTETLTDFFSNLTAEQLFLCQ